MPKPKQEELFPEKAALPPPEPLDWENGIGFTLEDDDVVPILNATGNDLLFITEAQDRRLEELYYKTPLTDEQIVERIIHP